MNINDVVLIPQPDDRLQFIFNRQRELMEKYHPIEESNGLLVTPDVPVDIDHKFGQARLKDMAWRCTEELAEAMQAREDHGLLSDHAKEELADALHFLVEMAILCGVGPEDVVSQEWMRRYAKGKKGTKKGEDLLHMMFMGLPTSTKPDFIEECYLFVKELGNACNCLKNKPWKQTHVLTDQMEFKARFNRAFRTFISVCRAGGILTAEELYNLYFRKSEVNKFRQRSNY